MQPCADHRDCLQLCNFLNQHANLQAVRGVLLDGYAMFFKLHRHAVTTCVKFTMLTHIYRHSHKLHAHLASQPENQIHSGQLGALFTCSVCKGHIRIAQSLSNMSSDASVNKGRYGWHSGWLKMQGLLNKLCCTAVGLHQLLLAFSLLR